MTKLTHGSIFAGIGGFDHGMELASFQTSWQIEIDPVAQRVLAHHWPTVPRYADVTQVSGAEIEPVDVVTFGSPCQDMSVAGRRAGLNGARSGLYFEAMRIIREMREVTNGSQPAMALWENVPGTLSSAHGLDFAAALDALAECGAVDIAWRIIDAQHWVPQRRRRLFTVACFAPIATGRAGTGRAAEILALTESRRRHPPTRGEAGPRLAASLTAGAHGAGVNEPGRHAEDDVNLVVAFDDPRRFDADGIHGGGVHGNLHPTLRNTNPSTCVGQRALQQAAPPPPPRHDPHGEDFLIAHTLRAEGADASEDGTGRGVPLVVSESGPGWWREGVGALRAEGENRPSRPSTVVAFDWQSGGDVRLNCSEQHTSALHADQTPPVSGPVVRRLTPRECERLQAFPDDWTLPGGSDSTRYRLLGNAVCVAVSEWLGKRLLAVLKEKDCDP